MVPEQHRGTVSDVPAIEGGDPVRQTFIPYGRQFIDDADIAAVVDVLRSDFLTTGPMVEKFERKVADYVGAKHAVAFCNGTAALHAAAFAAGIGLGDEVITSAMTFAASANCVLYMGGTPVFADIDPVTYNISPASIRERLTDRTKALIPVHYTGLAADLDDIYEIADERGLVVIEDGAHALGASYKNRRIGSRSHMTMFSLHPVKPITTGEGGLIVTDDTNLYEKMTMFRSHGITKDPSKMRESHGPWYHEMQLLGYNYRLTDIQAALGLSQMDKLDMNIQRRRQIAARYTEAFQGLRAVRTPKHPNDRESGWHLYVIRLNLEVLTVDRRRVYEALQRENIGLNVHYIPVYYHPYYQDLGYRKGICPEAERLYDAMITLPLFPSMRDGDVEDVVRAVQKVVQYYTR